MKKKSTGMKSAVELAMERLDAEAGPIQVLTDEQKLRIADVESEIGAKIAEREIFYQQRLVEAQAQHDFMQVQELNAGFRAEVDGLKTALEKKKDDIRDDRTEE